MLLNDTKSQHPHIDSEPELQFVLADDTGDLLPVWLVQQTYVLVVIAISEFKSSTQVLAAVSKTSQMLAILNRTFGQMPMRCSTWLIYPCPFTV